MEIYARGNAPWVDKYNAPKHVTILVKGIVACLKHRRPKKIEVLTSAGLAAHERYSEIFGPGQCVLNCPVDLNCDDKPANPYYNKNKETNTTTYKIRPPSKNAAVKNANCLVLPFHHHPCQ